MMNAQNADRADLIARLYPADTAGGARRVIESDSRCVRPQRSQTQSRSSRESTAEAPNGDVSENYLPYIDIKFSHVPRTRDGLVFGSAKTSDVILPLEKGVSNRHFALTFKDPSNSGRFCLTLRDLGSAQGTTVTYDTQANTPRSKFDWIVAGAPFCSTVETVLIKVHAALWFRLVVNHQDVSSPAYQGRVERFCRGAAGPGELMGALDLHTGLATRLVTGNHTPPDDAIVIERRLDIANTARVGPRFWNVSTGEECMPMYPLSPVSDRTQWQSLVDAVKRISHGNIVQLVGWEQVPQPRVYVGLLPLGTLKAQHERRRFSSRDISQILYQSLSGLADLHGQWPPLPHGNINLDTIFVQHRGPHEGDLRIRLSPPGFSAHPPHMGESSLQRDIWSLGCVIGILETGGLPVGNMENVAKGLMSAMENRVLAHVLRKMLVVKPEKRASAAECLFVASRLFGQHQPASATIPRVASSAAGQNQPGTARSHQQSLQQVASDSSRAAAAAFLPQQAIPRSSPINNPARSNRWAARLITPQELQAQQGHQGSISELSQVNASVIRSEGPLPPMVPDAPPGPMAGNLRLHSRDKNNNAGGPPRLGSDEFPLLAPLRNSGASAGGGTVPPLHLPPIAQVLNAGVRPSGTQGSGTVPLPPIAQLLNHRVPPADNNNNSSSSNGRPSGTTGSGTAPPPPRSAASTQPRNPVVSAGGGNINNNNARPPRAQGGGAAPPPPSSAATAAANPPRFTSRRIPRPPGDACVFMKLFRGDTLVAEYSPDLPAGSGQARIDMARVLRCTWRGKGRMPRLRVDTVMRGVPLVSVAGMAGRYITFADALWLVEERRLGEERRLAEEVREIVLAAQRTCG